MAAARDQAARFVRSGADRRKATPRMRRDLAEQLRTHVAEETKRQAPEAPAQRTVVKPAGPDAPPPTKGGRKKFVMMGVFALLALAAASYAVHYVFVGRFYVSTDDAYVRANNTMLGARVAGHVAAIVPGDNVVVRKGE